MARPQDGQGFDTKPYSTFKLNRRDYARVACVSLLWLCCHTSVQADQWPSLPLASKTIALRAARASDPPPVITAMQIHPNGRWVVAAGDDHLIRIIDLEAGRLVRVMRGHDDWVDTAAFSPDGRWLATAGADHRLVIWSVDSAQTVRVRRTLAGPATQIRFSHDGQTLAVVGFGCPLQLLNARDGELIRELECPCRDMRCVAFSPDDSRLAAAGRNGRVRVWDLADGAEQTTFVAHRQRVRALTFDFGQSHRDRLITAGEDRAVRVWSLPDGRQELFLAGVPGKVLSLAALPGDRVATACSDNVIRIWDLQSRQLISQLRGHRGSVASIDSNGELLVSAGFDATVRVWPINAMNEAIATLRRQQSERTQPVTEERADTDPTRTRPTVAVPNID